MPSATALPLGRTVLLTGAGCSRSAGVPLAIDIARDLCVRLAIRYGLVDPSESAPDNAAIKLAEAHRLTETAVSGLQINWDLVYQEIFTQHYRTPKETRAIFNEIFDSQKVLLNWTHLCIGEMVRLGFISTILTTNFDQLALEGIARTGQRLPVVADGLESLYRITGDPNYPQLIQIHGSRHTYRLRNSTDDVDTLAKDSAAIHAIDELMRSATVFLVVGYSGKEKGLMNLLTGAAKRYPDTQIFWVSHNKNPQSISPLTKDLMRTSRYSRVLANWDSDHFFYELLQELGLNAPKLIEDPMFSIGNLKDSLAYSSNPSIDSLLSQHQEKVERIQAVFDPVAVGRVRTTGTKENADARMQAVERLASGVAHDFNNVLTATIGYSDLLLIRHPPGDASHDDIIAVRESANKAARLVNKLLAFASSLKLRPQRTNLNKLISDLLPALNRFIPPSTKVVFEPSGNLWAAYIDSEEIENVVVELVSNAGQAGNDASAIRIATGNLFRDENSVIPLVARRDVVFIAVEDHGKGIAPEIGDRVFDPYFSTSATTGAGMGLSTAVGIIKQSGGEIHYRSEVGSGTTFTVYLPRHVVALPAMDFAGLERQEPRKGDSRTRRCVLYVEDEVEVRDFTIRALRELGLIVFDATGGTEAIRLFKKIDEALSLVISDTVMPKGDGPGLLRALRENGYTGPFIMTSGYAEDDIRRMVSEDLGTLFLPKPYSVELLGEAIEKALARTERE